MAKIRSCFLFQKECSSHKVLFWLWNWLLIIAAAAGIGLLSLLLAFGHYRWEIFTGYFIHPQIALLNVLPVVLLMILLYCFIGRAWIAFLATSVTVLAASAGNYFKLLCRDDPFLFADVTAISTALKVSANYDISLDSRLAFCIICVVLGTLFLAFFVRGRIKTRSRLIGAAVVLISIWPLSKIYLSENIYNNKTENYEYANRWSATQVYITRGFVYVKEATDLIDEMRTLVTETIYACNANDITDWATLKTSIKTALSSYLYKTTRRSPMILPVIMEV